MCQGVNGTMIIREQRVMCHCSECQKKPQEKRFMSCTQVGRQEAGALDQPMFQADGQRTQAAGQECGPVSWRSASRAAVARWGSEACPFAAPDSGACCACCAQFEAHAGAGSAKKWKTSLKVRPGAEPEVPACKWHAGAQQRHCCLQNPRSASRRGKLLLSSASSSELVSCANPVFIRAGGQALLQGRGCWGT